MQVRGLLVPEGQVADPLREDKKGNRRAQGSTLRSWGDVPSTVTFSETH